MSGSQTQSDAPIWHRVPLGIVIVYALALLVFGAGSQWLPEWDSALYLLTARSLADGEGYRYLGEHFTLRPPAFAFFLSVLLPAESFNFGVLNRWIAALAGGTVLSVYAMYRASAAKSSPIPVPSAAMMA